MSDVPVIGVWGDGSAPAAALEEAGYAVVRDAASPAALAGQSDIVLLCDGAAEAALFAVFGLAAGCEAPRLEPGQDPETLPVSLIVAVLDPLEPEAFETLAERAEGYGIALAHCPAGGGIAADDGVLETLLPVLALAGLVEVEED